MFKAVFLYEVSFWEMKYVLELDSGDDFTTLQIY